MKPIRFASRFLPNFEAKHSINELEFLARLTIWVDRLLPFDFEVVHVTGRTIGMADSLPRHPSELQVAVVKAETLWNEWFTVNSVFSLKDVLDYEATSENSKPAESVNEIFTVNRTKEAKKRQSFKTRDECDSRETSKHQCNITSRIRKMSHSPLNKL